MTDPSPQPLDGDGRPRSESEPEKLAPGDVQYLAFEGGGGKGGAYVGALAALSHEDVGLLVEEDDDYVLDTDQIDGIAGASAGAITATMLASEYTLTQMTGLTLDPRLERFFDPPGDDESYRPIVRRGAVQPITANGRSYLSADSYDRSDHGFTERQLVKRLGKPAVALVAKIMGDEHPPGETLSNAKSRYAQNVYYDYGFFSGIYARTFLSDCLVRNAPDALRQRNNAGDELTFAEHYGTFGRVNLAIVGTNVTTGEARYFRTGETGSFKVADAVRISMGIPFAFKPVWIDDGEFSGYEGWWVDGGTLNNYPIHAFDSRPGTFSDSMLGFRLGADETAAVDGIGSYAGAVANAVLGASSSREIRSAEERARTVDLPIGDLSTFDFRPGKRTVRETAVDSAAAVFEYFRDATGEDVGIDPDRTTAIRRFIRDRLPVLW